VLDSVGHNDEIGRVFVGAAEQGLPLFFSEFGMDLRGNNSLLNRYMNWFLAMAADLDFDWALWTLGGSYYIKQGVIRFNEYYGLLNWDWTALQSPFQGKIWSSTFHAFTSVSRHL
jgi:hypothetical protein